MPFWLTRRGASARQYSSSKISHSRMPTPRPPNSSGHDTTDHRSSNMVCSQARWASNPAAVSRDGRDRGAGACRASQARASARKASWAAVKRRSIGASMVGSIARWRVAGGQAAGRGNLTHRQISGNHGPSATMDPCPAP